MKSNKKIKQNKKLIKKLKSEIKSFQIEVRVLTDRIEFIEDLNVNYLNQVLDQKKLIDQKIEAHDAIYKKYIELIESKGISG